MRFLQEAQVSGIPILALPLLDLRLHKRQVTAEPELLAIAEPDVVVRLAFSQLDTFFLQACT